MPPLGAIKGHLATLHLSSNCLIEIARYYFCGFTRLRSIRLDRNKLLAVPNMTPLKASLTILDLSGNRIPSFEPLMINTTFPKLRNLGVSNNAITYLRRDIISCWPKLMTLHVRNNLLKNLEDLSGVIRVSSPTLTVLYSIHHKIYSV